jgi:hypothetical protein
MMAFSWMTINGLDIPFAPIHIGLDENLQLGAYIWKYR